jgi:4-nitrophenyl phosphatase
MHARDKIKALLVDLDGTVYNGETLVDNLAPSFFKKAYKTGLPYLFVTNRAHRKAKTIVQQLRALDIPVRAEQVLTSAVATTDYLKPAKAYVIGEEGLINPLLSRGFKITSDEPDYVIVGFDRTLTYEKIDTASRLIRAGSSFIATNTDSLVAATADRHEPGNGAAVAAIEFASGVKAEVIGKPNPIIFDMAIQRLKCQDLPRSSICMIGDNPSTDICGAVNSKLQAAWLTQDESAQLWQEWQNVNIVKNYQELSELVFSEK